MTQSTNFSKLPGYIYILLSPGERPVVKLDLQAGKAYYAVHKISPPIKFKMAGEALQIDHSMISRWENRKEKTGCEIAKKFNKQISNILSNIRI